MCSKQTEDKLRKPARVTPKSNDEADLARPNNKMSTKSFQDYADFIKYEIEQKQAKGLMNFQSFKNRPNVLKNELVLKHSRTKASEPYNYVASIGGKQNLKPSSSSPSLKSRKRAHDSDGINDDLKYSFSNIGFTSREDFAALKNEIGFQTRNEAGNDTKNGFDLIPATNEDSSAAQSYLTAPSKELRRPPPNQARYSIQDQLDLRPSNTKPSFAYRKKYAQKDSQMKYGTNNTSLKQSGNDVNEDLSSLMGKLCIGSREAADAEDEIDLRPSTSKGRMKPDQNEWAITESVFGAKSSSSKTGLKPRASGTYGLPFYPGVPNKTLNKSSITVKNLDSFPLKKDHNFKEMSKLLDKCNTQTEKIRSTEMEGIALDQNLFNLQREFLMQREKFTQKIIESQAKKNSK